MHLRAFQVVGKCVFSTAAEEADGGDRLVHPCGGGPGVTDGFDPSIGDWEWEFFGFGKKLGPRNTVWRDAESGEGAGHPLKDSAPWIRRYHGIVNVPVDGFLDIFRRNVFEREGAVYASQGGSPQEEEGRFVEPEAAQVIGREAVEQTFQMDGGRVEVVVPGQRVAQVL